jgi:hypothetical protein
MPHSEGYIDIFSITLYLVVKLRLAFYKRFQNSVNSFTPSFSLNAIETQTIIDLSSLIVNQLIFALLALLSSKVNKLSLDEVNSFPQYLSVYAFQLLGPPLICIVVIGLQFIRRKSIRKSISNQCRETIACLE